MEQIKDTYKKVTKEVHPFYNKILSVETSENELCGTPPEEVVTKTMKDEHQFCSIIIDEQQHECESGGVVPVMTGLVAYYNAKGKMDDDPARAVMEDLSENGNDMTIRSGTITWTGDYLEIETNQTEIAKSGFQNLEDFTAFIKFSVNSELLPSLGSNYIFTANNDTNFHINIQQRSLLNVAVYFQGADNIIGDASLIADNNVITCALTKENFYYKVGSGEMQTQAITNFGTERQNSSLWLFYHIAGNFYNAAVYDRALSDTDITTMVNYLSDN